MNKGENIAYAIKKEVSRFSLKEWLEEWGISEEDFGKFMAAGVEKVNEGDKE